MVVKEKIKINEGIKELVDYDKTIQLLARDRTKMANERTLLAYFRTGFSLIALGIALIKLFTDASSYYGGIIANILGVLILIIGFVRYYQIHNDIKKIIK